MSIDPVQVFLAFTVLVISLSIHEAAHACSSDLFGYPTASTMGRVTLNPLAHIDLIGWAKPVPVTTRYLGANWRQKFMVIAAAGPASNLVLACAAAALLHLGFAATGTGLDQSTSRLLSRVLSLNVVLAVFNMIPVPPLDGGNVLAGLLPAPAAAVLDRLKPYGFLILYALLLSGILSSFVFPIAGSITSWLD